VLAAAALAVVALLAAVLIPLALDNDPDAGRSAQDRSGAPSASPSNPQPTDRGAATTPPAASATPSATRTTTQAPGQGPGSPAPAQPPAGFRRYTDPTFGFSVIVPRGWTVGPGNVNQIRFDDPASSRYFFVETDSTPEADPYTNWISYEQVFSSGRTGYRNLGITRVDYGQDKGWRTADWEFMLGNTRTLNRNVLVNSRRAHALYMSAPESQWPESREIFDVAAASFVPAPVA
jgi:hypothetical protein